MSKHFMQKVAVAGAAMALFATTALAHHPVAVETRIPNRALRLESAKLRACQARESAIKNRSNNLTRMAENMLQKFDNIATRVKNSSATVENYDALVADIQAKKDAVQAAIANAKANFAGFACGASDPRGSMKTFRQDMQAVKKALKDYRASIKNLINADN